MSVPPILRPDRLPLLPAVGALAGVWLALTPSLLPRPSLLQGVLCGIAALLGYGAGSFARWVARTAGVHLSSRHRRLVQRILTGAAVLGTIVMLVLHLRWQRQLREEVGMELLTYGHLTVIAVVGLILFVILLVIARALRAASRFLSRQLARVMPPRLSILMGTALVVIVSVALMQSLLMGRLLERLDAVFMVTNDEFSTDVPAPDRPEVTAGPSSHLNWEDLGRQGRVFIANAPTAEQVSAFTGEDAVAPVRAYVGVSTDGDVDTREQAATAVDELERLGGLDREVINVVTGTGRGWVNENQAQALEYMWGGDTATVSIQYSYLPSWLTFLVDGPRAQDAGRHLFESVYARVQELPEDRRPLVVVSGESLGSFGGEAAFSGAQDLAERTSGALFVGPTGNNELWGTLTAERDRGTTEVDPVYDAGQTVRFSADGFTWPGEEDWSQPRVGYLQHANDPITWWTWSLAVQRPDWLEEPRGSGVHERTRWIPVVTMLQVAADQAMANAVPAGQGHDFGQSPVYAWAAILPPEGWGSTDSQRLAEELELMLHDEDSSVLSAPIRP